MASKEDVVAACRMLFDCEPENEQVVTNYATEADSIGQTVTVTVKVKVKVILNNLLEQRAA